MILLTDLKWLAENADTIGITILTSLGIYLSIIIITRLNGLRTFATMSSFDFSITIATGSIIASTILSEKNSLLKGVVALAILIFLQASVALLRKKNNKFERAVSNTPILLMKGPEILWKNLDATRVTESDLYSKLREANVTQMTKILAVVLETTGKISVLQSDDQTENLDDELLKFVAPSR